MTLQETFVLDFIKEKGRVSLETLNNHFIREEGYSAEELKRDLKKLIKEKKIEYRIFYRCPNCASIVGITNEIDSNNKDIVICDICDEEVELIDENKVTFFFLK